MTIALWLLCLLVLAVSWGLLLIITSDYLARNIDFVLLGRKLAQFFSVKRPRAQKSRYPLDLWVWETNGEADVCDECLDRASWPPMDIVEWIKEGLPRTPECDTHCGEKCRCQIVPYKSDHLNKRNHTR